MGMRISLECDRCYECAEFEVQDVERVEYEILEEGFEVVDGELLCTQCVEEVEENEEEESEEAPAVRHLRPVQVHIERSDMYGLFGRSQYRIYCRCGTHYEDQTISPRLTCHCGREVIGEVNALVLVPKTGGECT
jgi:hypothetical protein